MESRASSSLRAVSVSISIVGAIAGSAVASGVYAAASTAGSAGAQATGTAITIAGEVAGAGVGVIAGPAAGRAVSLTARGISSAARSTLEGVSTTSSAITAAAAGAATALAVSAASYVAVAAATHGISAAQAAVGAVSDGVARMRSGQTGQGDAASWEAHGGSCSDDFFNFPEVTDELPGTSSSFDKHDFQLSRVLMQPPAHNSHTQSAGDESVATAPPDMSSTLPAAPHQTSTSDELFCSVLYSARDSTDADFSRASNSTARPDAASDGFGNSAVAAAAGSRRPLSDAVLGSVSSGHIKASSPWLLVPLPPARRADASATEPANLDPG
jgi:hypothetical protein